MSYPHYNTEDSTSDMLAAAGFGHRINANTINTGRRTVFRLDDLSVVGDFTVFEADDFLKGLPA